MVTPTRQSVVHTVSFEQWLTIRFGSTSTSRGGRALTIAKHRGQGQ
jgi:hypothetical protein